MPLAYRKGGMNEADPLSRRPNLIPHATVLLFWDGEVPSHVNVRQKSQPMRKDTQFNFMIVNALLLSVEFVDLVRKGYSQDRYMGTRVSGRKTAG
jgi:hypothetical protein